MCGIFGFYLNRELDDLEISKAIKTLKLLTHRGPDYSNYYINKEKGIFLGHTRLSIVDLSKSNNQPFLKNSSVLVYNGEIYNYNDLKQKILKENLTYLTKGDTEVLSEILQMNDFTKLSLIDGMFAFGYFNKNNLYLGREIYGEKPL